MSARQILVTAALPYANGPIHLGHLVEYIQTDIWVRFQKLRGNRCIFICADDTHGTAIMIRARQERRSEEALIADMREQHLRDFTGFHIEFENYGSTHSEENRRLCGEIWQAIRQAGLVKEENVQQLYDPQEKTFLADRFVRGTCPNCKSPDQPGDNCSVCGHHYNPTDLIDPVSTLSGAKPELRSAPHLFIQLEPLHNFLEQWSQTSGALQTEIANYLKGHFLGEPLRDWDVSRPAPYFGFEIPDSPGNYWYVWFDAPIGYMASLEQWCNGAGEKFDQWWPRRQGSGFRVQGSDNSSFSRDPKGSAEAPSAPEIHHFIGKDITYFHTLFWPGMLKTAGFELPTKVHIHGFLTVGGEKMSKSKGTFVQASTYLKHLNPAYLRYYYASKLSPRVDDLDLNPDEFVTKVNSDLVGKVVNLGSRCAKFLEGKQLCNADELVVWDKNPNAPDAVNIPLDRGLFHHNSAVHAEAIAAMYESGDFAAAMRRIMHLADDTNRWIDEVKPWAADESLQRRICTAGLNIFRQLVIFLGPVLPELIKQTEELLNTPIKSWDDAKKEITESHVNRFKHMINRADIKKVQAMIDESKPAEVNSPVPPGPGVTQAPGSAGSSADDPQPLTAEPLAAECTIDDFTKVDLRVARILTAEEVPDARKLLKLTLSLGGDVRKTVFAGIKKAYPQPEKLVGRLVICVANLQPRQMKFGLSEGMVTAAGGGGDEVFLLSPDSGAKPGHRVH